ncbi:hypothetical protein ACWOBE_00120 [Hutsoniella sourekii]
MRYNQTLAILSTLLLTFPVPSVLAENISPIETIEWEASDSKEEAGFSAEEASSSTEANSVQEEQTPASFYHHLLEEVLPYVYNYKLFNLAGEQTQMLEQALVYDGQYYYVTETDPLGLTINYLVQVDDQGQVTAAYLATDDLVTNAINAYNFNTDHYKQTAIGQLVETIQAMEESDSQALAGKFIDVSDKGEDFQRIYDQTQAMHHFLEETFIAWLEAEDRSNLLETNDQGEKIKIESSPEAHQQFNELVQKGVEKYGQKQPFLNNFTTGLLGETQFGYKINELAIALLTDTRDSQDQPQGIEYYLQPMEGISFDQVSDQTSLSWEAFNQAVGFDYLDQLYELKQKQLPETFK